MCFSSLLSLEIHNHQNSILENKYQSEFGSLCYLKKISTILPFYSCKFKGNDPSRISTQIGVPSKLFLCYCNWIGFLALNAILFPSLPHAISVGPFYQYILSSYFGVILFFIYHHIIEIFLFVQIIVTLLYTLLLQLLKNIRGTLWAPPRMGKLKKNYSEYVSDQYALVFIYSRKRFFEPIHVFKFP